MQNDHYLQFWSYLVSMLETTLAKRGDMQFYMMRPADTYGRSLSLLGFWHKELQRRKATY